jgi:hypothetical protein
MAFQASGISMKSDETSGGAAVAIYKSKNITVTKVDAARVRYNSIQCTCFFRFHVHTCTSYLFFRLLPGMFDIFNTISHLLRK